jgi:VWFA-related protein
MRRVLFVALLFAAVAGALEGRGGPQQSYTSTTTAILVDVVVRDRKGQPVTDLTADDFAVFEEGARQKIDTFTRVSRGSGIGVGIAWKPQAPPVAVGAAARPASDLPDPSEESTTALVFDHLSSETLRLAQRATLKYIPASGESGSRIGVFTTGGGVRLVQRFTTDLPRVRQAVEQVMPAGLAGEESDARRADQLVERRRQLRDTVEAGEAGVVAGGGAVIAANAAELGARASELRQIQTELNMMRSFDNLDRDHKGYDTALGLLAVVQSLSVYPGRKTIVFFSEGLPVSPVLAARLDYVIDLANRANVTAYAIDANGLRAKSTSDSMQKEIEAFTQERLAQNASGSGSSEQPLTMSFERVEDTLRLDSRTGLARLASETGGFLVEGSNDLSSAFRRIDEDNQFHYLLTYSPSNMEFDGKFREIRVQVRKPGMQVFARRGYRAVRSPRGIDAGNYDLPALALLARTPLPRAFPMYASGFSFPEPSRPGLTPIVVKVRTDALNFVVDTRRGTYSAQAVILVRLRDAQGEVQKLSQQYLLAGDAKDVEAAKQGEILFYREASLAPGVHTVESIVYDSLGERGSARIATLTIPPPSSLGMSSLVLVDRVEELQDAPLGSNAEPPLRVGRTLLYPNVGEPFRRGPSAQVPFYFALYGDVTGLRASVQLLRSGQVVAEAPLQLASPIGGRVQHVGRLPVSGLPPGTYELRIRATDGRREESRTAFFTLADASPK